VCVRQLSGASFESLQPLRETLVSCLHRRLSVYTHVVNTHLLHILTHDHQLLDCLTTIRVSTSQFDYFVFHCSSVCCHIAVVLMRSCNSSYNLYSRTPPGCTELAVEWQLWILNVIIILPLFSSNRQHLSELWLLSGDKRGDYQNCAMLYCVLKLCSHKHT